MTEQNNTNDLMEKALKQLAEHQEWLAAEIEKIPSDVSMAAAKVMLVSQVGMIKLRMVTAGNNRVSVVWDYPDELVAFLRSDTTPKHLRDTLAGGHFVDQNQPAFSAQRVP